MSEQNKIDEIKARYQDDCKWAADPEDVRYLLQEIERLQGEVVFWKEAADNQQQNNFRFMAEIERKDEALEFYAHPINWVGYKSEHSGDYYRPSVLDDGGKRAREAL